MRLRLEVWKIFSLCPWMAYLAWKKELALYSLTSLYNDVFVHLIRISVKYVPYKDYRAFTASLKKVYGAQSLKACHNAFDSFKQQWTAYPGAIDVWERNFEHVEQLFDYESAVRKIMYTTNAVESIHSSFRKVTKEGAFPNENALLKVLYLRVKELENKWNGGFIPGWSMALNQLLMDDRLRDRVLKYN